MRKNPHSYGKCIFLLGSVSSSLLVIGARKDVFVTDDIDINSTNLYKIYYVGGVIVGAASMLNARAYVTRLPTALSGAAYVPNSGDERPSLHHSTYQ